MDAISKLDQALDKKLINKLQYQDALNALDLVPSAKTWQKFVTYFLAASGVGFLLSGVVFFFAYNWDELHKFIKLSLIASGMVSTLGIYFFTAKNSLASNLSMMASSVLVGVFFAVFGQIYQTGADAYEFFAVWVVCILVFTIFSEFEWQWVLLFLLINLVLRTYFYQVVPYNERDSFKLLVLLLNGLMVVLAEFLAFYKPTLNKRWLARIFITVFTSFLTLYAVNAIFSYPKYTNFIFIYPLITPAIFYIYFKWIKDLYVLAVSLISVLIFITMMIFKETGLFGRDFFIVGIWVVGLGISSAYVLKAVSTKWKKEANEL